MPSHIIGLSEHIHVLGHEYYVEFGGHFYSAAGFPLSLFMRVTTHVSFQYVIKCVSILSVTRCSFYRIIDN